MHGEINEQLPLFALGAIGGRECAEVEQHLAMGCDACEDELFELDRVVATLAFAAPPREAPAGLRARVLAAASAAKQEPHLRVVAPPRQDSSTPRSAGALFGVAALLAAAAFAIVFMAWALVSSGNKLDQAVRQLADARAAEDTRNAQLEHQRQLMSLIADPAARATELKSTTGESTAGLNVVWHPDKKQGVLVAQGLPTVEKGKAYELWLVSGATPVPAAVFNTDANGTALVEIESMPDAGAPSVFAITVEPAEGSKLPTGKITFAGKYAS